MRRNMSDAAKRPSCLSDHGTKVLSLHGATVPVGDDFWKYIADEQSVQDASFYKNNTENYIGTVKYPMGLIGPLLVKGEHCNREYFIPMASHEGALIASYSRGAKVITESGGVTARIKARRMLRAPVFIFHRIDEANDFFQFLNEAKTKERLAEHLGRNLRHCIVTDLRVHQTDRKVHLQIGIDSGDAAGQNKVTYAGHMAMTLVKEWYPQDIPELYVEGGFNSGKRVSTMHGLEGKGHSVVADCVIPKALVEQVLHTTPYRLQRFQKMHNRTNEFIGGLSCTAQAANGLTALYIATGQDPACVAESQVGVTHFDLYHENGRDMDLDDCDLYCSITLNSIIVATVGGGTGLPSFEAARSIMGVQTSNELAEVCAALVLAGEVSFYAAMEAGGFTAAHWNLTHKGESSLSEAEFLSKTHSRDPDP